VPSDAEGERILCDWATNPDCNERLLQRLPHRQMVLTLPKVLRVFFRHHKKLYGEIARRVCAMIQRFYVIAAGSRIRGAAVIAYASSGEFARFHPHRPHRRAVP